jgi:steroid Delta-isomerase
VIDSAAAGSVTWEAPDAGHPARRAAQRSMGAVAVGCKEDWPEGKGHRGRDGITKFWDEHVSSVSRYDFLVTDSFANGPCCANVLNLVMTLPGGSTMTVDCLIVYTVNEDGLITSIRAHWEPDRALATLTTP